MRGFAIFTALAVLSFASIPVVIAGPNAVPDPNSEFFGTAYAPTPRRLAMARRDEATHCVDDPVDGPSTTGNLLCLDLGGIPPGKRSMRVRDLTPLNNRDANGRMTCDECLGLNGNTPAVTETETTICYLTIGDSSSYGNQTSCPGDAPPPTTPDGSDPADIAGDIVDAWCDTAGSDGLFGWVNWAACFGWSIYSTQQEETTYDQNLAGIELLCDSFFAGLCTCFTSGACTTGGGGSKVRSIDPPPM